MLNFVQCAVPYCAFQDAKNISLIQEIHAVQWCYRIHDFTNSYYLEDLFIFGASFSFCFIFPNSSRPIHEVISSFYLWTLCKVVAILLRSRLTGSSKKIQDYVQFYMSSPILPYIGRLHSSGS